VKKLQVRILDERMRSMLPHYATEGAAGLDLRACIDGALTLNPGDSQLVSSGISIYVGESCRVPDWARKAASCWATS
jgi:dUTP pyrophosphatase